MGTWIHVHTTTHMHIIKNQNINIFKKDTAKYKVGNSYNDKKWLWQSDDVQGTYFGWLAFILYDQ